MIEKLIPKAVWWGLEGRGYSVIGQEISDPESENRKWVVIYALYKPEFSERPAHQYYDFITRTLGHKYGFFIIEIPSEKLGEHDNLYADDIHTLFSKGADSEEELCQIIVDCNVDPSLFTYPWRCNYPL